MVWLKTPCTGKDVREKQATIFGPESKTNVYLHIDSTCFPLSHQFRLHKFISSLLATTFSFVQGTQDITRDRLDLRQKYTLSKLTGGSTGHKYDTPSHTVWAANKKMCEEMRVTVAKLPRGDGCEVPVWAGRTGLLC